MEVNPYLLFPGQWRTSGLILLVALIVRMRRGRLAPVLYRRRLRADGGLLGHSLVIADLLVQRVAVDA